MGESIQTDKLALGVTLVYGGITYVGTRTESPLKADEDKKFLQEAK